MSERAAERTRYCSRCLTTFHGDPESCPNLACRTHRRKAGWGELLNPGDVLDRHYRIEQCLAIGGAGVTYLARELGDDDAPVGPQLAIKLLYSHRDHGPYLRRLSTEAQILQELDHPNIVRTMGFVARAGHSPYLLTRFESGGSLLDHLRRVGPMSITTVSGMGVQLCEALEQAHSKGVIHRDLKPENILLARPAAVDEVPLARLTDFGIAKVTGGVGDRLTRVGAFVGTPQYAAPEQFEGRDPSPATDLFSLAAVLQFCISLEPLTPPDVIMDPVEALERLEAKLPVQLDRGGSAQEIASFNAFLRATLAVHPAHRVAVSDARDMLQAIVLGRSVEAPTPPPPPSSAPAPESILSSASITYDPFTGEAPRDGVLSEAGNRDAPDAPTELQPERSQGEDAPTALAEEIPQGRLTEGSTGLTDVGSAPSVDAPAPPPAPAPKRRSRMPLVVMAGMVLGFGAGVCGLGGAWAVDPFLLPPQLRELLPPPMVLSPDDPGDAEAIAALQGAVLPGWGALAASCGVTPGKAVVLDLTVEPTGKLREIGVGGLDATQAGCVGAGLKALTYPRSGVEAVRVALQVGG
ncbi:MAG: serine/threonine protein kinase [Alphaproteobacteria bacterium]|nr:serine/threonine protein kinase [Alphaproteobacteria bacterium]